MGGIGGQSLPPFLPGKSYNIQHNSLGNRYLQKQEIFHLFIYFQIIGVNATT